MSETARLADLVMQVMDGDPWHGSNVVSLLEGVSHQVAAARPAAGGHSIWELVLHMTGWTDEVRARLAGRRAGDPIGGDWPEVTDVSQAAWARAVAALVASHAALADAVRTVDGPALVEPARETRATSTPSIRASRAALVEPARETRDPAAGSGFSQYLTVHGLVHHTAYHAGQIALLVKSARAPR